VGLKNIKDEDKELLSKRPKLEFKGMDEEVKYETIAQKPPSLNFPQIIDSAFKTEPVSKLHSDDFKTRYEVLKKKMISRQDSGTTHGSLPSSIIPTSSAFYSETSIL